MLSQPGVTGYEVPDLVNVAAHAGVAVPVTTRHAPAHELLEGRRLMDACEGVVVVGTVRLPLGGPSVRVALGVARSGDEVHVMRAEDGDTIVEVVTADRALRPDPDPGHDGEVLPGRVVAAARRYLGLPTAPPSPTPWVLLADVWAGWASTAFERGRRLGSDLERIAWEVLPLRPDMALFTQQRARAHVVAGGHPGTPSAVELRDAYADPVPTLAQQLPHVAIRNTHDWVAALEALDAGLGDALTRPGSQWDAACVLFDPPEDTPTAAPEWYDGPAMVRRVARESEVVPGAAEQLLARDDLPGWFVASCRRLLDAAAAAGTRG